MSNPDKETQAPAPEAAIPAGWSIKREGGSIRVFSPIPGPGGTECAPWNGTLASRLLYALCDALLQAPAVVDGKQGDEPTDDEVVSMFLTRPQALDAEGERHSFIQHRKQRNGSEPSWIPVRPLPGRFVSEIDNEAWHAWRARAALHAPTFQAEAIGVEVVGVVRSGGEEGPEVEWLLEGGLSAVAEGGGETFLLVSHRPITDDDGYGEVYRVSDVPVQSTEN